MRTNFNRNRNIIIFAICLLFVCAGNITSQISVPNPSIYLAFDTDYPGYESMTKKSEFVSGSYQRMADRFGNSQRAIKFTGKGAGVRCDGFDINAAHTVSFWVYISDPSTIPSGAVPFSPTDTKYEFYNWTDRGNRILKGLGREKATVGFNRYIPKPDATIVPWYLWSYAPAQFDQTGWYNIFVVHGMYYTRLIMYKPDSTKAYSYIWMGNQSFPTNKYLYVGGYGEHYPINGALDDYKVYNAEFTDDQIDFQHTAEYPVNTYLKIKNENSGLYISVSSPDMENLASVVQFPYVNATDEWILSVVGGTNECTIKNLHSSKLMVVKDASMQEDAPIVQYASGGGNNERWILEYSNLNTKYFRLKNKNSGKYLAVWGDLPITTSLVQKNPGSKTLFWSFENQVPNEMTKLDEGLYRVRNKKSGMYLSVEVKEVYDGAKLVQHSKMSADNESGFDTWQINKEVSNQYGYRLTNAVSGYSMGTDRSYDEYKQLYQGRYNGEGIYRWLFVPTGTPGEYFIKNVHNFLHVVLEKPQTAENVPVVQCKTVTDDSGIWTLERVYYSDPPLSAGTYKIRNSNSVKLMVVKNASTTEGAEIIQYSTGEQNSEWEILPTTYGCVQLRNKNSQKYLAVQEHSVIENKPLVQKVASTPDTHWTISKETYTSSGTKYVAYTLKNIRSGYYAVVKDASTADGTPIIQRSTGEKNKLWTFEKQTANALARSFDSEQETIVTDLGRPEVMVDCKNDIILLDYPFKSPTELIVRIMDLSGKQVYEGRRQVDGSNNVITISQFNSALNANQFYVISIRSTDGKVNCSTKAIMSK